MFLMLKLIGVQSKSSRNPTVILAIESCLLAAVWHLVIRMLDVVTDFCLTRKWKDDCIDKWKEVYQVLIAVDTELPHEVSKYHPGTVPPIVICIYCPLDAIVCPFLMLLCLLTHLQMVSQT